MHVPRVLFILIIISNWLVVFEPVSIQRRAFFNEVEISLAIRPKSSYICDGCLVRHAPRVLFISYFLIG